MTYINQFPRLSAASGLTSRQLLNQSLQAERRQLNFFQAKRNRQKAEFEAFQDLDSNLEKLASASSTLQQAGTFDQSADELAKDVQAFVDAINNILKQVKDDTSATEDGDAPLKNKQLPERVARSLKDLLHKDRSSETGGDTLDHLSDIGIRLQEDGTVSFNEEKFKEKFSNHPDKVEKLFRGTTGDVYPRESDAAATDFRQFADRQSDDFLGIVDQQMRTEKRQLRQANEQVNEQQRQLRRARRRQINQFTRSETELVDLETERGLVFSLLA